MSKPGLRWGWQGRLECIFLALPHILSGESGFNKYMYHSAIRLWLPAFVTLITRIS